MDPFSMSVAILGVLDISTRFGKYLKDVYDLSRELDGELENLRKELTSFTVVLVSIKGVLGKGSPEKNGASTRGRQAEEIRQQNYKLVNDLVQGCEKDLKKLFHLIRSIIGEESKEDEAKSSVSSKFIGIRRALRGLSKNEEYQKLRTRLSRSLAPLHLVLHVIQLMLIQDSQEVDEQRFSYVRAIRRDVAELRELAREEYPIHKYDQGAGATDIASLQNVAVSSAEAAISLVQANKHFGIPREVTSIYTGREAELDLLAKTLFAPPPFDQTETQKRFVIYGLGGSGKSEFCLKFAHDYRKNYWGVFYVDAQSREHVRQTYSRIAKDFAKRDPNERAGRDWLSGLEFQWLLIIDNANNSLKVPIETLLPSGDMGHVLITTRDESLRALGSTTPRYYHFEQLASDQATPLLLKAACKDEPWGTSDRECAVSIAHSLGCLPLALVYAGKAILRRLCTLQNYLSYYRSSWNRICKAKNYSGSDPYLEHYMQVYSSFELVYLDLNDRQSVAAVDALELLNMFAFFNNENIKEEILVKAAQNPIKEREEAERAKKVEVERQNSQRVSNSSWTLGELTNNVREKLIEILFSERGPSVLPRVLRDENFDIHRLKAALSELSKSSLINYSSDETSFCIHPVVQDWVRERPEMRRVEPGSLRTNSAIFDEYGETRQSLEMPRAKHEMRLGRQALWCEAAATAISNAILLPPLGNQPTDDDFRNDLRIHIDCIRQRQDELNKQMATTISSRSKWLPDVILLPYPSLTKKKALQLAKYSRVYAECGEYKEAEILLQTVRHFILQHMEADHPRAIRIQQALAGLYFVQGRGSEMIELLESVRFICVKSSRIDNPTTLRVTDMLGSGYWQAAKLREALRLHEEAIHGMIKDPTMGPEHEDTLRAIYNKGKVLVKYFRFQEAQLLFSQALKGMEDNPALGPDHLDTLFVKEDLAMTYLAQGVQDQSSTYALMTEVLERRKRKLGKEHPFTLLAILNLSRVKSAQRCYDEGAEDMRTALRVAERNLGSDHIGVLYGRGRLGQLLVAAGSYSEAEVLLRNLIDDYSKSASDSQGRDRYITMWYLAHCYRLQEKFQSAIDVCGDAIEGLISVGAPDHPLTQQLLQTREGLRNPETMDDSLLWNWALL